jgi:hypothetical protein
MAKTLKKLFLRSMVAGLALVTAAAAACSAHGGVSAG